MRLIIQYCALLRVLVESRLLLVSCEQYIFPLAGSRDVCVREAAAAAVSPLVIAIDRTAERNLKPNPRNVQLVLSERNIVTGQGPALIGERGLLRLVDLVIHSKTH